MQSHEISLPLIPNYYHTDDVLFAKIILCIEKLNDRQKKLISTIKYLGIYLDKKR